VPSAGQAGRRLMVLGELIGDAWRSDLVDWVVTPGRRGQGDPVWRPGATKIGPPCRVRAIRTTRRWSRPLGDKPRPHRHFSDALRHRLPPLGSARTNCKPWYMTCQDGFMAVADAPLMPVRARPGWPRGPAFSDQEGRRSA
jgi:hypothetical protein